VKQAQKNAVAPLSNLAVAYARRAMLARDEAPDARRLTRLKRWAAAVRARRDYAVADRIFRVALDVAGARTERAVASHHERGVALKNRGDLILKSNPRRAARFFGRAATALGQAADITTAFGQAADISPTYSDYRGEERCALAKQAEALAKRGARRRNLARKARDQTAIALREFAQEFTALRRLR
jgi:hypothetical protein